MSLSQQQIDEMIALSAPLVTSPQPWAQLSTQQRAAFRLLMPAGFGGFDDDQRFWLRQWWLPSNADQIQQLVVLCPADTVVAGRIAADGRIFLSADLLSDALDGGRLAALMPVLEMLPLTFAETITWAETDPVLISQGSAVLSSGNSLLQ